MIYMIYIIAGGDVVAKKQINFRVTEEQDKHLDEIAKVMGIPRSEVLVNMIEAEHFRLMGDPKLLEMIETMKNLKAQMEQYTK